MKKAIYFLAILSILSGCKDEGGKLKCNMTYNISNTKSAGLSTKAHTDIMSNRYTQFGDYITSITPSRFVGKFLDLRLFNKYEGQDQFGVSLIDELSDIANPQRLADFSNNNSVNFSPKDVNVRNSTELIYFLAICLFLYQEFELPLQYESFHDGSFQYLNLGGGIQNNFDGFFMGIEKTGLFVRASHENFMAPIFAPNWTGFNGTYPVTAHTYIFGNTDSTFVFFGDGSLGNTADNPIGQTGYIIRSNKHNPVTISAIPDGETRTITGTMGFNTTDLIQIYAGQDNIPYTSDDIFVYAPRFWERISLSLEYY